MLMRFSLALHLAVLLGFGLILGCRQDPDAAKRRFLASGDQFFAAGRYAEAVIQYRSAVHADPRAGDARARLADAYLGAGDLASGIKEYVRAADLIDDITIQLKAGNLLLLAGHFDDAKARAEKVLATRPADVNAQLLLANALAGLKDVDAAVAQIEEALRIAPERSGAYANLGALELGRGNRDAAEAAFKKAVTLKPNAADAQLALGNFYWATDRWALAEETFKAALDLEPRNPLTNRMLASFYLATNRLPEAEGPLKTVYMVTRTPASALALEEYYVANGQEASAQAILQPMLSDPNTAATANVRLAALDYEAGRREESYRRLAAVLARDQSNLQALLVETSLLLKDHRTDEAVARATEATQRHPDSAAAFFALGQVESVRRQPDAAIAAYQEVLRLNPRTTEAKIALGQLQLRRGRTDASLGLAAEALANEPNNGDAQLLYVRSLIAQGALDRAESELQQLMARFPNSSAVHTQRGVLLARQNKIAAARADFERALQLKADDLEAFGGLVAIDIAARNFAEARARVDARLSTSQTAPLLTVAARVYAESNDLASAERFLKQAVALDANYVTAYGALAALYLSEQKLDAARAEFEAMLERSPKSVAALTMVGILLEARGDWEGARDRFERSLLLDPEAAVAANNLAWIYVQHGGNLDVAMHLAQTAQKRMPDVPEVGDTLGYIYYKRNLASLAITTLRASAAKDPGNALYHYHLGLAYASSGDIAQARGALTRALALKSDFDGAEQARSMLSSQLR
jgi:tetratricopeptide (TPR) repeat protein